MHNKRNKIHDMNMWFVEEKRKLHILHFVITAVEAAKEEEHHISLFMSFHSFLCNHLVSAFQSVISAIRFSC